ncbi:cystathionine gamma-synthase, converts cysteine into cystathionine [Eremomyces bilateralis CBS 781.70]|uniref:Cystathionine gamma-synthase, converts cysteine into cystathionine n=1 Tax=Eremomyces bilateralis CBS 781.70 TaxID=1392243 RepID=A0A6G1GFH5_9PEZI|nr:cystathionine gamma-synthase, converts cysteine into cystathionine [Eremomyces bilateralis CBS 781.70]KAF1816803.1 cystathionine gamma-synthase, converts cysteine into cystathionine [Eremomyces bilateralis CBS 781.70]
MDEEVLHVAPIDTAHYHAIPPAPRHAVSTHLPGWDNVIRLGKKDPGLIAQFVNMYPRFVLHKDVKSLIASVLQHVKSAGLFCFPFPSRKSAQEFVDYVTTSPRPDGLDALDASEVTIRGFEIVNRLFFVFFPVTKIPLVMNFWTNTGLGTSSRLAEANLADGDKIQEVSISESLSHRSLESPAHEKLRNRIVDLLQRAPLDEARAKKVSPKDVFLYQNGMAAIFNVHDTLRRWKKLPSKTIMFGVPFHQTLRIFEYWGAGVELLPLGAEYDELERILDSEAADGRPVQAIWAEIPSNPLLVTSDLKRLRSLADKHSCAFVIDDTVGSFSNVDVLGLADIILTSLTKSFSGYADVMGGSATLNPSSTIYEELRPLFEKNYETEMFSADAEVLFQNSEDYLKRSTTLNRNAESLVNYLQSLTKRSSSSVSRVFYPTVSSTRANFDALKRPATEEFEPGYGCLFSVELDTVEAVIAFYNNLHVHNGPHLGAHRTIALAYVKGLYLTELDRVAKWGLKESQIRISVGLEDSEDLLRAFKYAVQCADATRSTLDI